MVSKLQLRALLLFFIWAIVSALEQNFLSCETNSPYASGYRCDGNESQDQCGTFAMLRTNSYYSSLFNLSFNLGINRFVLAEANGLSADTEFLPIDRPLLIPLDCKCKGGIFGAELTKTTVEGESFYSIAEALEGLTTCKAIQDKNPGVYPWGLGDKLELVIPLRCACPSNVLGQNTNLLLSYPVIKGDTISNLATKFSITPDAIISANNRSGSGFSKLQSLEPVSTLLIPLHGKPSLGSLAKTSEPDLGYPASSIPFINPHKRKSKIWKIGVYIAVSGVLFGATIAFAAAFLMLYWKRKKQVSCKAEDIELQQLRSSVRTTSEKKVSFDESQYTFNSQIVEATPQKIIMEMYNLEDLKKATEDFNPSNLIEDSVFHGRLNGKNLAIKRIKTQIVPKIKFGLFQDAVHHHPNLIRLLGTCVTEGPDSFLVFEYARNGSLKDWLHGGLAMKSQFISSCYCFLTWSQRPRICLDVAAALQYMHQIMNPSYLHRNIKSRNIFIDEEFNAKVGNFGMAGCVKDDTCDQNQESCSTHPVSWNKGYLAPEYLHQGVPATSCDIFAYGVVLLEVLSGQQPVSSRGKEKEDGTILLSNKIKLILESENAEELREWMDNVLGEDYSFDQAVTLANLARACIEDDATLRPNAGEIVEKLTRLVEELPGEQFTVGESSSKPLVKAAANNM